MTSSSCAQSNIAHQARLLAPAPLLWIPWVLLVSYTGESSQANGAPRSDPSSGPLSTLEAALGAQCVLRQCSQSAWQAHEADSGQATEKCTRSLHFQTNWPSALFVDRPKHRRSLCSGTFLRPTHNFRICASPKPLSCSRLSTSRRLRTVPPS